MWFNFVCYIETSLHTTHCHVRRVNHLKLSKNLTLNSFFFVIHHMATRPDRCGCLSMERGKGGGRTRTRVTGVNTFIFCYWTTSPHLISISLHNLISLKTPLYGQKSNTQKMGLKLYGVVMSTCAAPSDGML